MAGLQRGASLIITLLMLVAVILLGISAARIALQNEKASRNDRDRQIAFQAAEAALQDGELDIENSPDSTNSRSANFSRNSALGFPAETETACGAGETNASLGLCSHKPAGVTPAWQTVDFSIVDSSTTQSVAFGHFTGQPFLYGLGSLPHSPPRYVIELMIDNGPGKQADQLAYIYRLTAIGYGIRTTTQVVLQSYYRKGR